MTKPDDLHLSTLLSSPAVADWQARLTAAFFDADAKRQVIADIRDGVAGQLPSLAPERMQELQKAVIARLVAVAAREAKPPEPERPPAQALLEGAALEDRIITGYPYPIATPFRKLTEQESAAAAFGCLLDTFESLIHFLGVVAVSAYFRSGLASADCNRQLLEILVKPAWSTGDLFALLSDTIRLTGNCDGQLPYAELPGYLYARPGEQSASHRVLQSFVTLRNRLWGHAAGRDEAMYVDILAPSRARLERELAQVGWLSSWELVRPIAISEAGHVTQADLLMGERRLKGRPYDLTLEQRDLDHQGGDVRVEKSLLLVTPDRVRYLPLFPLSLFHFQLRSQGVYFLQRPMWQRSPTGRQLRKACYVAYESGLGEHEESPGDLAVRSLEQHVQRLEARLGGAIVPGAEEVAETEDPDVELVEVRHEQEFHLRTFAGREPLLQSVRHWIDAQSGGGYLLLLGPPGQGKSALMAELARRETERGGCLLHMVKSHRQPLKFVPALIRQAARVTKSAFGADAYRGSIDDLRNNLIRALEVVRDKSSRAVLLLDALDELETDSDRLTFLPETLPAGCRVVLTCRPDIPLVQGLRARLQQLEERPMPPLSEDDLPAVLERRLDADSRAALEGKIDWRVLFARLQGNPLFLRRALDHVAREVASAKSRGLEPKIDIARLPATLDALFQDIYTEIAEKDGTRYTSAEGRHKARLLQLLCLARDPLSFNQLGQLLASDGTPLGLEEVRDRLFEMSDYLLEAADNRYQPWHQGLVDYVTQQVLGEAGCLQLEEVFCNWLRRPEWLKSRYALLYRPAHLLATRRFDELADLLTDPMFLEAKVQAWFKYELAADFLEASHKLPADHPRRRLIELLGEAIRTDIHFVSARRGNLFQCAWNRAWWYDTPEAARYYDPPEGGWPAGGPPWEQPGPKVSALLESWRALRSQRASGFRWLRSLRPEEAHLGSPQIAVIRGHEAGVTCVAVSPDGRRIASGSEDTTVRVFDLATTSKVAILRGHEGRVTGVRWSADGSQVISGSIDRTIRTWDVVHGQELGCLRLEGHEDEVTCFDLAPDGERIVTGSVDRTVRLWRRDTGQQIACLPLLGAEDWVLSVAFSPDGRRIAIGTRGRALWIWKATRNRFQVGDQKMNVLVWDETPDAALQLTGHESGIWSVALSADGTTIASGSWDDTIRLWWSVALSSANSTRTQEEVSRLWQGARSKPPITLHGHELAVLSVAFSADGNRLVSGAADDTVRVWDTAAGTQLACLRGHEGWVMGVAFTPDGRRIVSGSGDGTIRVWDAAGGGQLARLQNHDAWVEKIAFTADGTRVVTTGRNKSVRIWDADTGVRLEGEAPLEKTKPARDKQGPWRAVVKGLETVIESVETGERVAWFPAAPHLIRQHPDGRTWIAAAGRHLYFFRLEEGG
jgi:WD40 repeat protein